MAKIVVEDTPLGRRIGRAIQILLGEALRFDDAQQRKQREYPKTVAECIDDDLKYRPGVYAAVKAFKKSKPWEGTDKEMQAKMLSLNEELAKIYEVDAPNLVFVKKFPVGPCCFPTSKPAVIMLQPTKNGSYSVVAYLHEFGHVLGKDEHETCRWSINLFKRIFPKQYEKLVPGKGEHDGHLLYKPKVKTEEVVEKLDVKPE